MTMETKKEIFDEHKARYWQSNRKEKGEIFSHICAVTGMHRKAAVRKFSKLQRRDPLRFDQRGRRAYYTPDVTAALKEVWEVGDQACGEDLHPMIPDYVRAYRSLGEWSHRDETTVKLLGRGERTVKRRVTGLAAPEDCARVFPPPNRPIFVTSFLFSRVRGQIYRKATANWTPLVTAERVWPETMFLRSITPMPPPTGSYREPNGTKVRRRLFRA